MLGWSVVLGIVYVMTAGALSTSQRGLKWNAGNRDETAPLTGRAARAGRAQANFLETFPFFAAAVLAVVSTATTSAHSEFGADLYFWARLLYLPIYVVGIPYVRTAVWLVSMSGLLMVLGALAR
jgi:uncharacterized MAPEG superfamily protein